MSNQTQAVQTRNDERPMEFVPYGAADKIKLSIKIIQNVIAVPTKSGATCSERDALRFMMLCQAQRLNPFAGDAYLVGYDSQKYGPQFSLITAHQVFLKRAETCSDYEGMESGVIILNGDGTIAEREGDFSLPDEQVVGGWAKVYRKGRKPTYKRLSIGQRKPQYETQFWQGAKANEQIVKCSEADALRGTFPTLLGGLYMQGELSDAGGRIVSEVATSRPIFEQPARLAEKTPEALKPDPAEDDGDLGPQKESHAPTTGTGAAAAQSGAERQVQQRAPEPPPESADQIVRRQVKALKALLGMKGHSEVEFIQFMHERHGLDDSLGTISEMGKVATATLAKSHDEFSRFEAEMRAWKEEAK